MALFLPLFVGQGDPTTDWAVLCYHLGERGGRWDQDWSNKPWAPEDLGGSGQYLYRQAPGWPDGTMVDPISAASGQSANLGDNLHSARLSLFLALKHHDSPSRVTLRGGWLATGNVVRKGESWEVRSVAEVDRKVVATAMWGIAKKLSRVLLLVPPDATHNLEEQVQRRVKHEGFQPVVARPLPRDGAIEIEVVDPDDRHIFVEVVPVGTPDEAWELVVEPRSPVPPPPPQVLVKTNRWASAVLLGLGVLLVMGLAASPAGASLRRFLFEGPAAHSPIAEQVPKAPPPTEEADSPVSNESGTTQLAEPTPTEKPAATPSAAESKTRQATPVEAPSAPGAEPLPPSPNRTDQGSRRDSEEGNSLRTDPTSW